MAGKKLVDFSIPRPRAECAYDGCRTPGLVREKLATGWANLCEYHMLQEHTRRANAWCAEHGLHTRDEKIAFCREMAKKMDLRMRFPTPREPGCDDEPVKHFMPSVEPKPVAGS